MLGNVLLFLFMGFAILCALVPGLWMLFFPEKAFTTRTKPRWLGVPVLFVGLVIAWTLLSAFFHH